MVDHEREIKAAKAIALQLETIGVDYDIALHQGFVLVENFMPDVQPVIADQLIVLQQDYLDICQDYYMEAEARAEEDHHYMVDRPHR